MGNVKLKPLMSVTAIGAISGLVSSACFAVGPIVRLGLFKIQCFDLSKTSVTTMSIASDLVAKGDLLAVQSAVLEHGYQTMMAGALIAACAYIATCFVVSKLIREPSHNSSPEGK